MSGFSSATDYQERTRVGNVIALLETLTDASVGTTSGEGPGSRGDRLLLMGHLYHRGSYAELERCLKALLRHAPSTHWHTVTRYRDGERVTLTCPYKRSGKNLKVNLPKTSPEFPFHVSLIGHLETVDSKQARVRVSRWNAKVRQEKADKGVRWLAQTMRGAVQLPPEFLSEREAA